MPKITKRLVESLNATDRDVFAWDDELRGFGVRAKPSGVRTYLIQYRNAQGRSRRFAIGQHGRLTAEEARREAKARLGDVERGKDPVADREAESRQETMTVKAAASLFVERYAKRQQRHWKETERILKKYVVSRWGRRDIGEIKRSDVVQLLDHVEDNHGPIMANRTLAAVRKMFNWLLVERAVLDATPVVPGMSRANERARARQRWLRDDEIRSLWGACEKAGWPFGPFVKFMLVTGQRRGEVAAVKWRDLDLESELWTIPADGTKAGREHEVPLNASAIEILEAMPRLGEHVFTTGRRGDKPLGGFTQARGEITKSFKASEAWTFHDLRRTFSTHLTSMGIPRLTVSRALNHVEGGVTQIYDRHSYLPEKRHALDAWSRKLESIIRPAPGKVVELADRR